MNMKSLYVKFLDSDAYTIMGWVIGILTSFFGLYLYISNSQVLYLVYLAAIFTLVFGVIDPILKLQLKLLKEESISLKGSLRIILTTILVISLLSNVHDIILSGNQVLYMNYTYAGICILGLFIIIEYTKIYNIINDDSNTQKGRHILFHILAIALTFGSFYLSFDDIFIEQKTIDFKQLQTPVSISLSEINKTDNRDIYSFSRTKNMKIENELIINELFEQLRSNKLDNLRGITFIDYMLKGREYPYYRVYCDYIYPKGRIREIDNGYIGSIKLYSDGDIIIHANDYNIDETLYYKAFISEDLTNEIISLVE